MEKVLYLEDRAFEIRKQTIRCIGNFGMGHIGGSLSIADVLSVLYFDEMKTDPKNPKWNERDRLVLSKAHAGPALYAALAVKGYFPLAMLDTLNKPGTLLPSHCDMTKTPGVDMTAGSLGQGMSAAAGMALGAKLDGNPCRIFCILGEGDNQEGQTWEAVMYSGNMKLNNLIAFTDRNKLQIDGTVDEVNSLGNLEAKYTAFGWYAQTVKDGNDVSQILDAVKKAVSEKNRPSMIILDTIKGKGVDFMENRGEYHHAVLTEDEINKAYAAYQIFGGDC